MLITTIVLGLVSLQGQVNALPHTDFAEDAGGWTSIGPTGKLSISRDVLRGQSKGSLKFEYNVAPGGIEALILPTAYAPLGKMKSLRFWIRPDYDTTFGIVLEELDGGRYVAIAAAQKDTWQLVELNPNDFSLADGGDDPIDPNGKLDLSLVQGIGLADMKQMFAQAEGELAALFGVKQGPHVLYLSDFLTSESLLPDSRTRSTSEATLDTLDRPQLGWLCAGRASASVVRDGPVVGRSLKMEYEVGPTAIAGLLRAVTPGALAGMDRVEFSLATVLPCTLLVQLEEKGGGKYNAMVPSTGLSTAKQIAIPFSEFEKAEDSVDGNETLDLAAVKQLVILDATGIQAGKEQSNTLWLGPIVARANASEGSGGKRGF